MARLHYECNSELKNESAIIEPYACTPEKYCLYCNSQCCFVAQRRPPRYLWETWYFWLGVVLLTVFVISSVSSYIVSNYRHNIQGAPSRHNPRVNANIQHDRLQANSTEFIQPPANQNQISISIIPSTDDSVTTKALVMNAHPSLTNMTPIVA